MDALLKKLQYRSGPLTVVGAPPELASTLEGWSADRAVSTRLAKGATFVVAFVRSAAELHRSIGRVVPKLADSAVLWFAYPKKSSTRYPSSDLGRDESWKQLGDLGFEAVRQVAIDADWSAVRFRRAEEIRMMVRDPSRAMSRSGRARTTRRPAAVVEFLRRAREGRAPLIEAVDATIRRVAPELKVGLDGRFLGYGPFHYRYPTGHEGDTFVVSMMDGAQALSVYVNGGDGGQWLVEGNAERLGRVSVGKSCIRVKRLDQINLDVLGEIVRTAADQHAAALRAGVSEGGTARR